MTVLKRWTIATLAAATVVAAGAGESGNTRDGDERELRDRIERMEPAAKRQLLEKREQFRRLSAEKQDQLRQLHRDLQAEENREELERVMKAYFEWVRTLSASERSHLHSLTDPEERLQLVIKYRTSPGRRPWRRDGFGSYPPYGRGISRNTPPGFVREVGETLKIWAGPYIATHADELAALLPPEEREKWKAHLQQVRSESTEGDKDLWRALVRWYLAGPAQDLPITDADVADFEKLLTPDTRKWYAETPLDLKIPSIQHGMRGMLHFLFASGSPDLKDLVTAEELNEFEKSLPPDRRDSLARLPAEMRSGQLRFSYFLSKLPEHLRGERDGRYSSGRGGPPHGDQRHDGPPEFRRGPRNDLRDRGDEPPPGAMRPDRPGMQPPPGEMRPDRPGRRSPPGEGPGEEPE